jgi:hypothetical protein
MPRRNRRHRMQECGTLSRQWNQFLLKGISFIVIRVDQKTAAEGDKVFKVWDCGSVDIRKFYDKRLARWTMEDGFGSGREGHRSVLLTRVSYNLLVFAPDADFL